MTENKPAFDDGVGAVLVYATFPDAIEATALAETLVSRGLIACANVIAGVTSIYIWEGKLVRDGEVSVVMKTRRALADDVVAAVRERHSYDNPAIVVLPIVAGSADFLAWVEAQTALGLGGR
jgi:periplasmic divalent cation tolerance protein